MTADDRPSPLTTWREERGILRFVADNFNVELDPWQEEALLAFESPKREHRRISLQACAGPAKARPQPGHSGPGETPG